VENAELVQKRSHVQLARNALLEVVEILLLRLLAPN
jgi:hypothetical protein